jgi:hypothetical protein
LLREKTQEPGENPQSTATGKKQLNHSLTKVNLLWANEIAIHSRQGMIKLIRKIFLVI